MKIIFSKWQAALFAGLFLLCGMGVRAQSISATQTYLPSNHGAGTITVNIVGVGTTFTTGTGAVGTQFSISGAPAGWSFSNANKTFVDTTHYTLTLTCPAAASPPAGATGSLTVNDTTDTLSTAAITVATPTVSIAPSSGQAGLTYTLSVTGTNTYYSTEATQVGLFSVSGGTAPVASTKASSSSATAAVSSISDTTAGTVTFKDTSTGATTSFTVTAATYATGFGTYDYSTLPSSNGNAPLLWVRAEDITSQTTNTVLTGTTWSDKTANANNLIQATSGSRPFYVANAFYGPAGPYPALNMSSSKNMATSGSVFGATSGQSFTMYIVCKHVGSTGTEFLAGLNTTALELTQGSALSYTKNININNVGGGDVGGYYAGSSSSYFGESLGANAVIAFSYDGVRMRWISNGDDNYGFGLNTSSNPPTAAATVFTGTLATSGDFVIGSGSFGYNGMIAEVIYCDTCHSQTLQKAVVQSLMTKYGIMRNARAWLSGDSLTVGLGSTSILVTTGFTGTNPTTFVATAPGIIVGDTITVAGSTGGPFSVTGVTSPAIATPTITVTPAIGGTVATNAAVVVTNRTFNGSPGGMMQNQPVVPLHYYGDGWSGTTAVVLSTRDPLLITPYIVPNSLQNIVMLWVGTNDIGSDGVGSYGSEAANIYHYIKICTASYHSAGAKVILCTIIGRYQSTGQAAWDTTRQALNTLIRGAVADGTADSVCDLAWMPNNAGLFGFYDVAPASGLTAYYEDGTHLNDLGNHDASVAMTIAFNLLLKPITTTLTNAQRRTIH